VELLSILQYRHQELAVIFQTYQEPAVLVMEMVEMVQAQATLIKHLVVVVVVRMFKIQGGAILIAAGGGAGAGSSGVIGYSGAPLTAGGAVNPATTGGSGSINGGAGTYSGDSNSGGGGGGGEDGTGSTGGGAGGPRALPASGGQGYINTSVYSGVRNTIVESTMTPKAGGLNAGAGTGTTGTTGQIEIIVNGVSNSYTSAGSFSLTI
jgi:hypothetical protein